MKKSLFIATALLALAACTREMDVDTPAGKMTITARTETSADTRTVVEGETHVYWEPGDEIAVYTGGQSGRFTTNISEPSAIASFYGKLNHKDGADLWALYPYSEDAEFDGETITTSLPSEQVARPGSFGKDMNLSIAHSMTSTLQFFNVGGGVRFSLLEKGITKVVLRGLNGETIAGKVKIGFQKGVPSILNITEGKTSITLTPPEGEAFEKDAWYFFVAIPGSLENGFIMDFHKANIKGSREFNTAVSIKRGFFGTLVHADDEPCPVDAVDIGLSVKWATCNLGATKPSEYGDYYAWGEDENSKVDYYWTSYKWCGGNDYRLTKYNSNRNCYDSNFVDNKLILDIEDDVARAKLGGRWRIPTSSEMDELLATRENANYHWEWASVNGHKGCLITYLVNNNTLFLPVAGYRNSTNNNTVGSDGRYWTNTRRPEPDYAKFAYALFLLYNSSIEQISTYRCYGLSIRPVWTIWD